MILDGASTSKQLFDRLISGLDLATTKPTLAAIQVGDDPASSKYLRFKQKRLESMGMGFELKRLPVDVAESVLESVISELNSSENIHGIILQLPVPGHLDTRRVLDLIAPIKDVDCLTSFNIGRFFTGSSNLMPATPYGVIKLLEHNKIDLAGKEVCIVGRSNLVGKPLAVACTNRDATVTLCHSRSTDIKAHTTRADIVITAVGKPRLFTADYFKPGQIVVDVGLSKDSDGVLKGDTDFERIVDIVEYITPVPGGVGPMTIYSLVENLVTLYSLQMKQTQNS